jgi:hypothetical protein
MQLRYTTYLIQGLHQSVRNTLTQAASYHHEVICQRSFITSTSSLHIKSKKTCF